MPAQIDFSIVVLQKMENLSGGLTSKRLRLKDVKSQLGDFSAEGIEGGLVTDIKKGYIVAFPELFNPKNCSSTNGIQEVSITQDGLNVILNAKKTPKKERSI